jgi:hypothetical protein
LYFNVVQPAIQGYRAIAMTYYRGSSTPVADIYDGWASGVSEAAVGGIFDQLDQTSNRLSEFVPVAYFVGHVRDHGLQLGGTMQYAWYALVPRIIWPSKPAVNRGAWFSVYLGFARSEDRAFSLAMTAIGELYWNFGCLGVLCGMFTLGVLHAFIWRLCGLDPRRKPLSMTFYTSALYSMHEMAEAVTTCTGALANALILKAALVFIHEYSKKS